jgi:DnaJ-class molecular chaperone
MVADRQLYDVLGVAPDATSDEIKRAFKKLAIKFHPDKQSEDNKEASETKFKEISEAYSTISDAEKRKAYDAFGIRDGSSPGGGGPGFDMRDVGEVFAEMFAGGVGGSGGMGAFAEHFFSSRPHPSAPRPDVIDVSVSLDELRRGSTKKINYEVLDKCETCDGVGAKDRSDIITCITCSGRGVVMHQLGPLMLTQSQCHSCGGRGETIKHNKACGSCNGAKRRMYKRSIDIKIPAGVPNGFAYSIAAKGSYNMTTKKNVDIVLNFVHRIPHGVRIDYESLDVHVSVSVTIDDVFCGFDKNLQLYNTSYKLRKHKYFDPSKESVVKNLGIPAFKTKCFGNLVIHYEVGYPSDAATKERFERYKPAFLTIFKRESSQQESSSAKTDDTILNLD